MQKYFEVFTVTNHLFILIYMLGKNIVISEDNILTAKLIDSFYYKTES